MDGQLRELQVDYNGKAYELSASIRPNPDELIVFLHGWGGSKECFSEAFSSDELKNYGLCTIDFLGFGKSKKPEDFSYDLLDHANVAALAINSLEAQRVYLVGHSMGGGIGILAAPLINRLVTLINAESNLAPNGSAADARAVANRPYWLFKSSTLPLLKSLLRVHPKRSMRPWAEWYGEASPLGLYKTIQSLVQWSDSGNFLPLFEALPHKAYIYGANGKRKKDVVPRLDDTITYEVPRSGHSLMTDNPKDFYAIVASIIRDASVDNEGLSKL
jgi:pimeloyl-ACP methyl ester carboxylesterase